MPAAAAIPPSESWHAARVRNRGGAEAEADDAARKAAVDALTATALEHVDFGRHTALCFGNERLGVSAALAAACDGAMTIPMYRLTESLNVSVAAALAIHYGRVARAKALGARSRETRLRWAGRRASNRASPGARRKVQGGTGRISGGPDGFAGLAARRGDTTSPYSQATLRDRERRGDDRGDATTVVARGLVDGRGTLVGSLSMLHNGVS